MAFNPTESQKKAIYENGNILVSAAAGSGKTAVLVERVITRLCDKQNPVRADELLIVTFTNAAAAEMRSRIEARLDEECRNNPFDAGLLLQKHLLANAKICTIDSFCIDLVRENFDKLGISPDFKIGEESSLKIINNEVLYSIINRYFEEKNPTFFELLDIVGSEFDESNFCELILTLYNFSRQLPFPQKWFDNILENYENGVFSNDNIWYNYAFQSANNTVSSMKRLILGAIDDISCIEDASNAYLTVFLDAKEQILSLEESLKTGEWNEFYVAIQDFKLNRLPSVRGLNDFPLVVSAKDTYKYLNTKAVENLKKIFYAEFEFISQQHKKLYKPLKLLIQILKEYDNKLFEAYKEQNVFTFHNTEHLALKLLYNSETGQVTEEAKELIENFREVMVDEFQDTNDLQNMLFSVLSDKEKKLFVVGDVKQSIYAFRGANPNNFLDKKNRYINIESANENDAKKIILGNNFRSSENVCNFVNYFFSLFMQNFSGNIIYNDEEKLIPTAKFPETEEKSVSMDIIDCSSSNEKALILEARQIAQYIKKTIKGKPCIKQDDNTLRKAKYGDFAILLRSVTNKAPELVSELKNQGIPVNLSVGEYAQSLEIATFLSLLKVIDNPQSDVELATVLMSPIFRFTPDDLASIRTNKKDGNLYSALILAANNGDAKTIDFLEKIKNFRLDSVILPLDKLISKLLVVTEYLNIASSLSDGEKRRNNLLLLSDYAVQYASNNSTGISGFVDFVLKQSQNLSVGAGANKSDAVKIMSIHASKGLQFPICILASTSSRFNDMESRFSAAFSVKYGLGFKYFDEKSKKKYTTLAREVILDDIKKSGMEEELRLLYVAMTRAQDKLHFIASYSNFSNALAGYKNLLISTQSCVDYSLFSRTKSYADWLILALLLHPDGKILRDLNDGILPLDSKSNIEIHIIDGLKLNKSTKDKSIDTASENKEISSQILNNFEYKYPYQDLIDIGSKISVSALANKAESDKFAFSAKPSFLSGGITATGRGTAMHKVMEFFDFEKYNNVEEELDRLYEWQFISEDERDSLNIEALKTFFKSEIFERIKSSDLVKREMRFMSEIPVTELDNTINKEFYNEKIIVQGAVDVCFLEEDGIVILDFKTDKVESINELAEAYGGQLSVYAKACEKIFHKKVKEKIIYSFAKSDIVKI